MDHNASQAPSDILRLIAKNLTETVMAYDMSRKLVFVNPAVETLTGYSMEELESANFICWIHPEDQPRMLSHWDELFSGRSFHEEEYRLMTKDGRVKWVVASWTPILDDSGRQLGVQGREYEITQRKLAETALRQSEERLRLGEERYRLLFEDSPFPMWEEDFSEVRRYLDALTARGVSDIRGYLAGNRSAVEDCVHLVRILDVNRAARDFYGARTKEELIGGLGQFFDEAAFEIFRDEIATLAENQSTFQVEYAVRTLEGDERIVDVIVAIVDSARHDWSRVIVTFFDITDRKRVEDQFIKSQKMESLGRLAGGIAHDFNNLLTVINGYTDWILREMEPDHRFRAQLAAVRDAGDRCAELTNQLLAFSRTQIVRSGPLDLNLLIRESQAVLDHVLGDDIEVAVHLSPDLGIVNADRGQMHQVLLNLAVNAREAMPNGGVLTIETRNVPGSGEVLVEIRDTGHGMDERTRGHLFEPFFTTKQGSKNSGLGLSIVFGIVSNCGGHIEVLSQPGKGAAFRVFLPRLERPAAAEPQISVQTDSTHRGAGVVLVVDDREEVRTLTCSMLKQLGYEALAASSGPDALAVARSHSAPIPLLLTDVIMPGMNGREAADLVRQIHPGIKTIFMSGYSDRVLSNTGSLETGTLYLQKPFTLNRLADVLRLVEQS